MTPRQEAFAQHYIAAGNATQAAKEAGYSARTAYSQGQRLLKHFEVQRAIAAGRHELSQATKIDREWILNSLHELFKRVTQEVRPVLTR